MTAARRYLGVTYFHCGRNEHGLDCAGLILVAAWAVGLTDWDEVDYSEQVDAEHLRQRVERFCDKVCDGPLVEGEPPEREPQAGDVLLMSAFGNPQHLGFATGEGTMIHAYQSVGRVTEHGLDRTWRRCTKAVYRWRANDRNV